MATGPGLTVVLRPARSDEAETLSAIAWAAKRHWGYPDEVMAGWRQALTITPAKLAEQTARVAKQEGVARGFAALAREADALALTDLWVAPAAMGQGIGRRLVNQALTSAAQQGAAGLSIDADPMAEALYLRLGAARRGSEPAPLPDQPERIRPQLWLPVPTRTDR